jgi:hypothetical protein
MEERRFSAALSAWNDVIPNRREAAVRILLCP